MQFTAQELKDKLLRALDADCNVVDLQGVLEVISTLEKYPVTKAQLEQTRLGKLVNDLRKKTSNRDLAKRAKQLVRKWHDFIGPSSNAGASNASINGERLAGGQGGKAELNSLPQHLLKGASGSKPASPASGPPTPSSNKSSVSPSSLQYAASTPGSSRPETPLSGLHSRLSPRLATHPKPASPLVGVSSNTAGGHNNKHSPNISIRTEKTNSASSTATSCQVIRPSPTSEAVSKVNVANKRKRRGPGLEDASTKLAKFPMLSDNADGSHKTTTTNNGDSYKNKQPGLVVNGDLTDKHYSTLVGSRTNTSHTASDRDRGAKETSQRQVSPVLNRSVHNIGADSNKCETPQQQTLNERRNTSLSMRTDLLARLDSTPSSASPQQGHLDRSLSACSSPVVKTPKVKTTAQLIQELHNNAGMRLSGSETVTRIAMNQIEKEPDIMSNSVVPPEAKPRYRRKPGTSALVIPPSSNEKSLSKTKSEMVEKFLMSSIPDNVPPLAAPTSTGDHLIHLMKQDDERVDSLSKREPQVSMHLQGLTSSSSHTAPTPDVMEDEPKPEVDIYSLLPPLDLDAVNLEDDSYEVPEPKPVGVTEVEKLETEHWPGVNGQLDHECNWQDWTNTYSVPSVQDNLLHMLPYVCLDND